MKLFSVALMAAFVAVALSQEGTTTSGPDPTTTTTTTTTTTAAPTTKPTTETPPTTTTPSTTTVPPTTTTAASTTSTTGTPSTTTPPSPPKEPTLTNYTVMNGEEVCALILMKVTVTDNSTSYPFVNATVLKEASSCNDSLVTVMIKSHDDYTLQLVIEHDNSNFYIAELAAHVPAGTAERDNLTQFSTPLKQYYKCSGASEVSLGEQGVKVVFSDMKYQAFQKAKTADFTGSQLECTSDAHSDVVIIAIGCALALLVVVILVAYLIARKRNRQRGYQSV